MSLVNFTLPSIGMLDSAPKNQEHHHGSSNINTPFFTKKLVPPGSVTETLERKLEPSITEVGCQIKLKIPLSNNILQPDQHSNDDSVKNNLTFCEDSARQSAENSVVKIFDSDTKKSEQGVLNIDFSQKNINPFRDTIKSPIEKLLVAKTNKIFSPSRNVQILKTANSNGDPISI